MAHCRGTVACTYDSLIVAALLPRAAVYDWQQLVPSARCDRHGATRSAEVRAGFLLGWRCTLSHSPLQLQSYLSDEWDEPTMIASGRSTLRI